MGIVDNRHLKVITNLATHNNSFILITLSSPTENKTSPRLLDHSSLASLFSKSNCKKTYQGSGDTYYGMDQIKDLILTNHNEINATNAVKLFKGNTLQQTISNIHYALNTHIQYNADGWEQHLRAPNCAWQQRETGIDCKSFTALSSILLLKCGIKHYLRKIKQPLDRPNEFSHIYVVIPTNQTTTNLKDGYYVLDATLQSNVEPIYTKHYDIFMEKLPYYSLKGANSAQAKNVTQKAIDGFIGFLQFLKDQGVSDSSIQTIHQTLNSYLIKGVDPLVSVIDKGITIQDAFFAFKPNSSGLNTGDIDLQDIQGIEGLDQVFDSNFFGSTFGSVFANGMNFTCWNSTFTPQQTSQQVNTVHIPTFNSLFNNVTAGTTVGEVQTALNFLEKYTANANKFFWHERVDNNWEQCSRLALDIYTEYYREMYPKLDILVNQLKTVFNITHTVATDNTTIPVVYDHNSGPVGIPYQYKVFSLQLKAGASITPTTTTTPISTPISTPVITTPATTNVPVTGNNVQTNGMGTGAKIAAALALSVGGAYLGNEVVKFMNKKKTKK